MSTTSSNDNDMDISANGSKRIIRKWTEEEVNKYIFIILFVLFYKFII